MNLTKAEEGKQYIIARIETEDEELAADEKGKYYELWHAQAQYYTEKTE